MYARTNFSRARTQLEQSGADTVKSERVTQQLDAVTGSQQALTAENDLALDAVLTLTIGAGTHKASAGKLQPSSASSRPQYSQEFMQALFKNLTKQFRYQQVELRHSSAATVIFSVLYKGCYPTLAPTESFSKHIHKEAMHCLKIYGPDQQDRARQEGTRLR